MTIELLRGRRAVVVGGSTGIGRGVADAWAAAGADVVVCSRSAPTGTGADRLGWVRLDLTDPARSRAILGEIGAGQLHAACFSSIYYGAKRANFSDLTEAEWREQLEVNVTGLWLTLAATLPALRAARPGLFVGVSSEVVFNAGPGRSGYAATKAAAKTLLDSVAQEEDRDQVRIVQIMPDQMVDSPGIRRRRPKDFDYSSYLSPADFGPLATELVATNGHRHHGDCLVVGSGGTWWSAYEKAPVSQSRQVPA